MKVAKEVDFLIVGQGLAGSTLSLELLERGQQIFVIDEPQQNHSTVVAAGLFNPITGKLMTKTWKADLLFPYLIDFYSSAEKKLGADFFYPMPLYRPFISIHEQNEWMGKSADSSMSPYVERVVSTPTYADHIHDDFGGLLLKQCGYVDTTRFVRAVRENLIARQSFSSQCFDEKEIVVDDEFVVYREIKARKIIFCCGFQSTASKYFGWLPLKPLKGETLQIKVETPLQTIYNRGVYIVPTSEAGTYKVGATYNTKDLSEAVTANGKQELSSKLSELLKLPYKITNQDWGIRPTSPDRKPFLGAHPENKNVIIFNGLGTKGVSLAPYFASQLANWLVGKGDIDPEVNISRFKFKK